jgi:hypothetical protein
MLGYNTSTIFQVRMPIGNLNSTLLQILVQVRDKYDCVTEVNLPWISVLPDMNNIISLIKAVESTLPDADYSNMMTANSLISILYDGNQNDVCQILTSVSQMLNILAQQNLQSAIHSESYLVLSHIEIVYFSFEDNISAVSISVSPLNQDNSVVCRSQKDFSFHL